MCVRYSVNGQVLEKWRGGLQGWVGIAGGSEDKDLFPGDTGPIVLREPEGLAVVSARWGLIPSWVEDPNFGRKSAYNARAETISEKASFRNAFRSRRCLVPAAAFFERAEGRWLRLLPTEGGIAFAGLFEPANKVSETVTYCFATTEPNEVVATFHDRMPVVLDQEDYDLWLDPQTPTGILRSLLVPCLPERLKIEDAGPIRKEAPSLFE